MLPNEGGTYKVSFYLFIFILSGWVSIVVWCNVEDMWFWLGDLWTHSDIQRLPIAASDHLNVEIDLVILISSGLLLIPFSFSIHGRVVLFVGLVEISCHKFCDAQKKRVSAFDRSWPMVVWFRSALQSDAIPHMQLLNRMLMDYYLAAEGMSRQRNYSNVSESGRKLPGRVKLYMVFKRCRTSTGYSMTFLPSIRGWVQKY